MKRPDPQAAFSIPDMIMGLSIIAVAIVGIMAAQNNYIQMSGRVETGLRALSLANSVMQTVRMHAFDEQGSDPWSLSLGPDAGEASLSDYDDVDDYAAAVWNFSAAGFSGFTVNTRVFNVDLNLSWLDSVGPGTNYKRIIVSVDHSVLEDPVILSSLSAGIVIWD